MEYIKVGAIAGTHGLQGELNVKPFTQFTELRFSKGATIYMETSDTMKPLIIKTMRMHKDRVLLTIDGYSHINDVEAWIGNCLYITYDQLHTLDEDEVYYFELMHCQVYDGENHCLGEVVDIIETGANVVLRVQGDKELLIPYVDAFIKIADIKNKKLVVELLEGMA